MTEEAVAGLNHRLEGPEGAPVLVLSNSLGATLGMWDDRAPELREHFRLLRGAPAEGYAGCCEAIRDADLRDDLGAVRAPALVIAGAEDPAAPVDRAEEIRDSIPDARLVVLESAAHLANVEQPEGVTREILAHLEPVVEGKG